MENTKITYSIYIKCNTEYKYIDGEYDRTIDIYADNIEASPQKIEEIIEELWKIDEAYTIIQHTHHLAEEPYIKHENYKHAGREYVKIGPVGINTIITTKTMEEYKQIINKETKRAYNKILYNNEK